MENKTTKILMACNVVLLLGLIGIYILHFTSAPKSKVNPEAAAPLQKEGGLTIAYVDTDTLLAKYEYAKELEEEILAYKNQQEQYGRQQIEKFQKDYQDYLKNGANMTRTQQEAKEAELKQRSEKMATLEQELTAKIMERQMEENTKLLNAISRYGHHPGDSRRPQRGAQKPEKEQSGITIPLLFPDTAAAQCCGFFLLSRDGS